MCQACANCAPQRRANGAATLLFLLVCGVAWAGLPATSQTLLTTIPTGSHPVALAHESGQPQALRRQPVQ